MMMAFQAGEQSRQMYSALLTRLGTLYDPDKVKGKTFVWG